MFCLGDAECVPKTVVDFLPEKPGPSPKDSPKSMSPSDEHRQEMSIPSDSQKRYYFCREMFSFLRELALEVRYRVSPRVSHWVKKVE